MAKKKGLAAMLPEKKKVARPTYRDLRDNGLISVTIWFSPGAAAFVDATAEEEGISRSGIVKLLMAKGIEALGYEVPEGLLSGIHRRG